MNQSVWFLTPSIAIVWPWAGYSWVLIPSSVYMGKRNPAALSQITSRIKCGHG